MAAEITSEQKQEFVRIIDSHLRSSDLATVTARKVRGHLQDSIGYDITHLKDAVKELIEERFENILAEQQRAETTVKDEPNAASDDEPLSEPEFVTSPSASPKATKVSNKRKLETSLDDDAKLAAKLHQELNASRPSRSGSAQRKKAPVKKRTTKKSKVEVSSGDEGDQPEKKKRQVNRNNPFNAPMQLSEPLQNLIGKTECSRPECVKHIWAYVKENGLQDPDDKRYILCDDTMKPVFNNAPRVHMFTMNKVLSGHLFPMPKIEKVESV